MNLKKQFGFSRFQHTKSLYWLAVISVAIAIILVPLWVLDSRQLLGVSVWEKPLKFFISVAIFSFTYSWLSSFLSRGIRWIKLTGLLITVALAVEIAIILTMASIGQTSHFNISSPTAMAFWSVMGTLISVVFFATIFISVMLLFQKLQEPQLKLTLALGSLNTLVGMGVAYFMAKPPAVQVVGNEVAGAHAVGIADGGPGLPFLGWSTVAGDLRVGHFFGLHSIQVAVILLAISLALPIVFRLPLLIVGNLTWLGFVGLVTWQALRAEPFSSPSEETIISFAVLGALALVIFIALVLIQPRTQSETPA